MAGPSSYSHDSSAVTPLQKSSLQQLWQLRYFEDFSNPASGWPIDDNPDRQFAYLDGEYRIFLKNANYWAMVRAGPALRDAAVEVEARQATNIYGTYGLLFGISDDWSEIYTFEVDDRGNYQVWEWDGVKSEWESLRGPTFSVHINPRQEVNRLRVERVGDRVSFYANGYLLATERVVGFTGERRLGIIAWSHGTPDMDTRFDNYKIFSAVEASPTATITQGPTASATMPQPTPTSTLTSAPTSTEVPTEPPTPAATETATPAHSLYQPLVAVSFKGASVVPTATPPTPTATTTLSPTGTQYEGQTDQSRPIDLSVKSDHSAVTRVNLNMRFSCDGITREGTIEISSSVGWPIQDGNFTVEASCGFVVTGTFTPNFQSVSGDWQGIACDPFTRQEICRGPVGGWDAARQP